MCVAGMCVVGVVRGRGTCMAGGGGMHDRGACVARGAYMEGACV